MINFINMPQTSMGIKIRATTLQIRIGNIQKQRGTTMSSPELEYHAKEGVLIFSYHSKIWSVHKK